MAQPGCGCAHGAGTPLLASLGCNHLQSLRTASPTSVESVSRRNWYGGWWFAKDRKESREYALGLFLLSTYKRRPPPPHLTPPQGKEHSTFEQHSKGLGPRYLARVVRERCEGEFGEEPDLSVSPLLVPQRTPLLYFVEFSR